MIYPGDDFAVYSGGLRLFLFGKQKPDNSQYNNEYPEAHFMPLIADNASRHCSTNGKGGKHKLEERSQNDTATGLKYKHKNPGIQKDCVILAG
ncbi:TPA: hypothetical protein I8Y21_001115 [Klebsiella oxytoca]|uniref:Uncharacterized protein n=1 Tax=Klebsiella oxytoca TaxID=571 RepID=A0AAN5RCH6_KLEOX|nr:hypothetical protein [Klebsiella oxytoca]